MDLSLNQQIAPDMHLEILLTVIEYGVIDLDLQGHLAIFH